MRILRGKWQGRTVPFPKGAPTRPLTEKAREALFNILTYRWAIEGAEAMDLFAGSGAIGLEFLSRGAARVRFVEKDPQAIRHLRTLLAAWGVQNQAVVLGGDVLSYLSGNPEPADFIFAGPPFRFWQKKLLVERVLEGGWLKKGGCFILEHPLYEQYDTHPAFWRQERYVASGLSFFVG